MHVHWNVPLSSFLRKAHNTLNDPSDSTPSEDL